MEKIILVHGLFMNAYVMQFMQSQLEKKGYEVFVFSYRSIWREMPHNAERLLHFANSHNAGDAVCHFVGHSLGGLLIRLAYERDPACFSGRIVTLGTPHQGSEVAHRIINNIHENALGGAYDVALDGDLPTWTGKVELGSIAGTKGIGVGMVMKDLPTPHDGTVTVAETHVENETDHIEVALSHTALIYSRRVAEQIDSFLRCGRFAPQLL